METRFLNDSSAKDRLARTGVRAVVVTLRRCTSRAANVQKIIESCPLPCEVFEASDGTLLDQASIERITQPGLHSPSYPFALRPGEIGCYLSHRRIWQQMVEQSINKLLVVEDDVSFLPNFSETLEHAIDQAPDGSYVQFQVRELSFGKSNSSIATAYLVRPELAPLRTSAQLVTLGAARRLLEFSQVIDRPVDAAIQMTWLHGAEVLVSMPRSVIEVSAELGGSTISNASKKKRKPFFQTVQREWKRSVYRRSIAKAAWQYHAIGDRSHTKQSA